jgi:cytochrome c oxidase subunit 3
MFFGGMFLGYALYRSYYPEAFAQASHHLDILLGGINTAVLIGSSLTMALAVHAAQVGGRRSVAWLLIATMILGSVFLGIKYIEYSHKFAEHHFPGANFQWDTPNPGHAQMFFVFYFCLTGMHALHMIVGIAILAIIAWMAWHGRFSAQHYAPVEITGLYWHFVDIVWIFLFPLLYLVGAHQQ